MTQVCDKEQEINDNEQPNAEVAVAVTDATEDAMETAAAAEEGSIPTPAQVDDVMAALGGASTSDQVGDAVEGETAAVGEHAAGTELSEDAAPAMTAVEVKQEPPTADAQDVEPVEVKTESVAAEVPEVPATDLLGAQEMAFAPDTAAAPSVAQYTVKGREAHSRVLQNKYDIEAWKVCVFPS